MPMSSPERGVPRASRCSVSLANSQEEDEFSLADITGIDVLKSDERETFLGAPAGAQASKRAKVEKKDGATRGTTLCLPPLADPKPRAQEHRVVHTDSILCDVQVPPPPLPLPHPAPPLPRLSSGWRPPRPRPTPPRVASRAAAAPQKSPRRTMRRPLPLPPPVATTLRRLLRSLQASLRLSWSGSSRSAGTASGWCAGHSCALELRIQQDLYLELSEH